MDVLSETEEERVRNGLIAAFLAYFLWGVLPIYFRYVQAVPVLEVLAHRIIWAVPFCALIIALRRQWHEVGRALVNTRTMSLLLGTSVLIACNWLAYIYAVQQEQIFQASLGYYINPLIFALAGVVFFGERLSRGKTIAVSLAAIGVLVLTFSGGELPTLALALAVFFTAYGVIRKYVVIGAMPGLFIETVILLPAALAYLAHLAINGDAVFGGSNVAMNIALVMAGPITAVPLLLFALGARRLNLSTIGMLQFLAPTMQFFIGMHFGERLTTAHVVCFACIWLAVSVFAYDAWLGSRNARVVAR